MSQQIIVKCDICGKVKGDANKWIKYAKPAAGDPPYIWIGTEAQHDVVTLDACSDACIQKALAPVLNAIREFDGWTTAAVKEIP